MIAPNSTRGSFRAARGLVTGTVIGLAALGFSPAFGQSTNASGAGSGAAFCQKLGPTKAGVECAVREFDKQIDAKNKHAACTADLTKWATGEPAKQSSRVAIVNQLRGNQPPENIDTCALLEKAQRQEFRINGGASLILH